MDAATPVFEPKLAVVTRALENALYVDVKLYFTLRLLPPSVMDVAFMMPATSSLAAGAVVPIPTYPLLDRKRVPAFRLTLHPDKSMVRLLSPAGDLNSQEFLSPEVWIYPVDTPASSTKSPAAVPETVAPPLLTVIVLFVTVRLHELTYVNAPPILTLSPGPPRLIVVTPAPVPKFTV